MTRVRSAYIFWICKNTYSLNGMLSDYVHEINRKFLIACGVFVSRVFPITFLGSLLFNIHVGGNDSKVLGPRGKE